MNIDKEPYQLASEGGLTYTSPSGRRFRPRFTDVPVERSRRVKSFDFIDTKGTYIQSLGMMSSKIALNMYFIGPRHHEEAQKFEQALAEDGVGSLALPLSKGVKSVYATKIKKHNKFVDAVNRTTFEVTFAETIEQYQSAVVILEVSTVLSDLASQRALSEGLKIPANLSSVIDTAKSGVARINVAMQRGLTATNSVKNQFDSVMTSLDTNASLIFEKPLIFASQVQKALSIPIFPRSTDLVSSYGSFIDSVSNDPYVMAPFIKNVYLVDLVFGTAAISQLAVSANQLQYKSRNEALEVMDQVKSKYEAYIASLYARETFTASLPLNQRFIVDPKIYESLYALMQSASSSSSASMAGLKKESIFTTDYDTATLVLASKHYLEEFKTDSNLAISRFIQENQLSGDRVIMLPRGTEYKVLF